MTDLFCYICLSNNHSTSECIPASETSRTRELLCYICFSKNHSVNDCVYAVPYLFFPNIDQNLFPRFIDLLVIEEKLLLMFTYPRIFVSIQIKPIKIMEKYKIKFSNKEKFLDVDLVLANRAKVNNSYFGDLKSRIAFRVEQLEIISFYL